MTSAKTTEKKLSSSRTKAPTVNAYSDAAAALPDEYFLGQVVSFTISEADIELDAIRELVVQYGLSEDTLKKKLRPVDAFKKAANDIATRFPKTVDAQHSFMVRPVGETLAESHRHVVFERAVFQAGVKRRVEHFTVMRLIYERGERRDGTRVNDAISALPESVPGLRLTPEERAWLDSTVGKDGEHLRARYEHYCTHLDSHGFRTFVREYLLQLMGAINVKGNGGGLYFVQQKHAEELRSLALLVKAVGSQMHLIPLLDIVEQRDMLAEAFIADTNEEIRQVSAEIGKILQDEGRTITEATYDNFVAKATGLIEKAKEYQQLLDRNLDSAHFELNVFQKKTLKLVSRVRNPASVSIERDRP